MHESHVSPSAPEVRLSLEVDPSLGRVLDADDPLNAAVHQKVSRGLDEILSTLGIPGSPTVQIAFPKENSMPPGQFVRVTVNGEPCRYPDELLQRAHSYANDMPFDLAISTHSILEWLRELSEGSEPSDLAHNKLVDFVSLTCLEIVKRRPAVLLGLTNTAVYAASLAYPDDESHLQRGAWPSNPAWLVPILSEVLNLRISIADKQTVAGVLALGQQRSSEDISEDLIAALRPDVVEIEIPREYLQQITTAAQEFEPGLFMSLRDLLLEQFGLTYPSFRFVPNEDLKPNSFAFRINHLTTLPWIGLRRGRCLVNEAHNTLALLDIQGTAASIPTNRSEASVIDLDHRPLVGAVGLTTWNQFEYLVICLSGSLIENGASFLHRQSVQYQLDLLYYVFPALISVLRPKISVEQITRILRALVSEEVSIRNLRLIVEQLLDYDYLGMGLTAHLVLGDSLSTYDQLSAGTRNEYSSLTSFVRIGLKRQICDKYTGGTSTLSVLSLDPEIEQLMLDRRTFGLDEEREVNLDEDTRHGLLEAIRNEVADLSPSSNMPAILTRGEIRSTLREILAPEFPRIPVLSRWEIPSDTDLQPVGVITLNT